MLCCLSDCSGDRVFADTGRDLLEAGILRATRYSGLFYSKHRFFECCVVLGLGAAFFLWKFTNSLLAKETVLEPTSGEIGVDEVIKIILACMGIYFAINAVVAFPRAFVEVQIARSNTDCQPLVSTINLASVVLQIIFGCLLIAKP